MRWVIIQILVVWFFWRLITPFLVTTKMSRRYRQARMTLDVWLFAALVLHVPAFNAAVDNAPSRVFLAVFVFFLVSSHALIAAVIVSSHVFSWLVNGLCITVPWLPSGEAWKNSGMKNLVRASIASSLLTSLGFVHCTVHSRNAHDLCRYVPDFDRNPLNNSTQVLSYVSVLSMRFLHFDLAHLSFHSESPVGLLWLSAISLGSCYWVLNRSAIMSRRARRNKAMGLQNFKERQDSLRRINIDSDDVLVTPVSTQASRDQPKFLPMSEWYSLTVVDAAVQLLVSLKIFFGRFDFRALQTIGDDSGPVRIHKQLVNALDDDGCFWFDWIADTGDGGDSTYQIARLAARKYLSVAQQSNDDDDAFVLTRPPLLVLGGDLVYPTPSIESYDERLFTPFNYALEHPSPQPLASDETMAEQKVDGFPLCFAIPGNHDYLDGMFAFSRCILDRDWLGGWRLPQQSTYFALQLPHGWWLFGLDQALNEDIDGRQLRYFARVMKTCVRPGDRIIVATHEPVWALDAYDRTTHRSPMLKELLSVHVGDRLGMRIAGDVHNYMRHVRVSKAPFPSGSSPVLIVAGGGGAFLHPTHTFPVKLSDMGAEYDMAKAFPDFHNSRQVALENLGSGFRVHNWGFDMVGAALYFAIVVSLFPRCGVRSRLIQRPSGFTHEVVSCLLDIFMYGNLSLVALISVIFLTYSFTDAAGRGLLFKISLGLAHGALHLFAAISLFIVLEFTVETALHDGLVASTPSNWYWRLLDLPEAVGYAHRKYCSAETLSRFETWSMYLASFLYTYVLTADLVALIVGVYLFVSGFVLGVHWNEAYSSVRCQHWKSFCRFKIESDGTLHCFAIGVERVPGRWKRNPSWQSSAQRMKETGVDDPMSPKIASFAVDDPGEWVPATAREEENGKARLIDYWTVKR